MVWGKRFRGGEPPNAFGAGIMCNIFAQVRGKAREGCKALSSFASGLGEDIAHNASAKIVERFTTTEAFAHHLAELDALRLRVDRLSAKISQQERSATDNSNQ